MNAVDLKSCSSPYLHLIEECGCVGFWSWSFASGAQYWSPGLLRLLGVSPSSGAAGYDLLVDLIHPEDRTRLASPGEVLQGYVSAPARVRLIRPTGELLNVSILSELHVSPEGRPLMASGAVLDVTELSRLRRMQAIEQRHRQALYRSTYSTTYAVSADRLHSFPSEMAQVHGLSLHEINDDPFVMVVPEERAAFRERAMGVHDPQTRFQGISRERLADGEVWRFRIIGVPLWDGAGRYIGRAGMKYPVHESGAPVQAQGAPQDGRIRRALEQTVHARHLRAARAMLDWSMATLAAASGLSLSTVRRLEDDAGGRIDESRHRAVAALRRGGIRFIAMDDGTLALAKT
ncbi:histidine kinase [Methylobacterium terricola]|uniref:Histidine kinase n=1 Tax=Methylobacterium terricola TaxID=2583531 RepID=A0A5C4LFM5_9HYPH|nr:histidine kinase [Methylobacterium terricola]TNC11025.1 histidine kinase [Methylobacterium terricola]